MDWDDLRFVLAVARHHTLAGAAAALGVSHTTVGRRIAALEADLGARLFERMPEGLRATEAGRDLVETGELIEADLLSAEARVRGRDAELRGELRLSTLDLLFQRYRGVIASFVERYPEIALTVTTTLDEVSLTRREADVVLRLTNTPPEHLVGRRIGRVSFAAYASRTLVARIGEDAPLDAYPWLGWDERLPVAQWFAAWRAEHAPGLRIVLRTDESALVRREAIVSGVGAQFLACFEGDALPEVQRIGPAMRDFDRDVWLLTLRELRHTSRIRALLDHVDAQTRYGPGPARSEPE